MWEEKLCHHSAFSGSVSTPFLSSISSISLSHSLLSLAISHLQQPHSSSHFKVKLLHIQWQQTHVKQSKFGERVRIFCEWQNDRNGIWGSRNVHLNIHWEKQKSLERFLKDKVLQRQIINKTFRWKNEFKNKISPPLHRQ